MKIPDNYNLLFDSETIKTAIGSLALKLDSWAAEEKSRTGNQLVLIAPLRGALFFASDLARQSNYSIELRPIMVSSYAANKKQDEIKIESLDFEIRNRHVVIVDEICDTGRTLQVLKQTTQRLAAHQVNSLALVLREHSALLFRPDLVGLTFNRADWLVGYGMDDKDHFRNLPEIYTISK